MAPFAISTANGIDPSPFGWYSVYSDAHQVAAAGHCDSEQFRFAGSMPPNRLSEFHGR